MMCIHNVYIITILQQLDLKSFESANAEGGVPVLKLVWQESASEDKKTSIEQVQHIRHTCMLRNV